MDTALILVTPSKKTETFQQGYSENVPLYFLAAGKCLLFVLSSLRYEITFYSAINRQEALGKEKKSYEFIIPEKKDFSF